jgi:murein DD-endopeptidase MepM/ murein hydrolase activator NlpD
LDWVKTALAATTSLLLGITLLPVVLANGDTPPPCAVTSGPVEAVLATIRDIESGGNYQAKSAGSSASGAYQFLDSTWNSYGGYPHASDAPPDTQDAKAAEQVSAILDAHGQDVAAVPVVWYIGHLPEATSTEWDVVPAAAAGNRLTPRQYQTRWMNRYQTELDAATADRHSGDGPVAAGPATPAGLPTTGGCLDTYTTGGPAGPVNGQWAFPLPRSLVTPAALRAPHHDYPAIDILIPEGTPVYALTDGTVVRTTNFDDNWWNHNCPQPECDTCGIGLSVQTDWGLRYIYCHGNHIHVHLGDHITAGQHILDSGNTGYSGAPHLHLELKLNDTRICPQPLLVTLHRSTTDVVVLHDSPYTSCTY